MHGQRGQLKHVLWTIEELHKLGFWVEIVTLVVPGFNDSNQELWEGARFIAGVSRDVPWHVTPEGRCPRCQTAIPGIWWPNEEARRQGASVLDHRIERVF